MEGLSQLADVAATYARLDASGEVLRGGWSDLGLARGAVRVLHTSAPLPPDLIAVRTDVSADAQSALARAFVGSVHDTAMRPIVKRVLGVDGFVAAGVAAAYDDLRRVVDAGASSGVIDASTMYMSTEPPPAK